MPEVRVVPREPLTLADARRLATDYGWRPDKRFNKDAERLDTGKFAWVVDKDTRVTFVGDIGLAPSHFIVEARDPTNMRSLLGNTFSCVDDEEIRAHIRTAETPLDLQAVLRLVAGRAPEQYEEDIASLLQATSVHPDVQVRLAAAWAAYQLGWSRLRPLVERMRDGDEDDLVRAVTRNYLGLRHWDRG